LYLLLLHLGQPAGFARRRAPHFHDKVVSELRQVPGFVGAQLNRRPLDDKIEFLVLTRWQSMDAIRAFAGTDAEKAVVLSARNGLMQRSERRARSCLFDHLVGAAEERSRQPGVVGLSNRA